MEIEKKYKVDLGLLDEYVKSIGKHKFKTISQKYLALTDDEEIRLRIANGNEFTVTYKKGNDDVREEIEFEVSEEMFTELWPLSLGLPLTKTRFYIPYNDKTVELDIYAHNDIESFAEIEFDSIEEIENFEKPEWLGEEVSIKNKDLYKKINQKYLEY